MAKGEIFKGLPQWAQGVIAIGAVAGAAYIVYALVKAKKAAEALKGSKQEINTLDEAIKNAPKPKETPLNGNQLATLANQIFTAMDGAASLSKMGTDEAAIYRAFANVRSDVDVLNLRKTYGVRKVTSGSLVVPDFQGTLGEALTYALDAKEMKALNDMLAKKGIKTRF